MITLPNILSLMRFPLAFFFLQDNVLIRLGAIILAMATDGLDGYIARKFKMTSRIGTVLDPIMDKFFVFFVLIVFLNEGRLLPWEAVTMLCRDFSVFFFGLFLALTKQLSKYQFRAIWCGKITTLMQFSVLIGLTCNFVFPAYLYGFFIILGLMALIELYMSDRYKEVVKN
jgi:CDP-diacylglycerol---glycerol-3-phosphate 3-phosphatidyltransferase